MDHCISTNPLTSHFVRWQSTLEARHPAADIDSLLHAIARAYGAAAAESLWGHPVWLGFPGDGAKLQVEYRVGILPTAPPGLRRRELCENVRHGMKWLEGVLLAVELLDELSTPKSLHATYGQLVWSRLKRIHAFASPRVRAARQALLCGSAGHERMLLDALDSGDRWSWSGEGSGCEVNEAMYQLALKATAHLHWIEAAAFAVAGEFARLLGVEPDYETFTAIQARALGRAARLQRTAAGHPAPWAIW